MIVLSGASWNYENKFYSLYKKEEFTYTSLKDAYTTFVSKKIINREINNFRRISMDSKLYSLLAGLVFHDSKIKMNYEIGKDTGVVSCTYDAATPENEKYFRDYVSAGRKMARGNLFVYTLPTSSLGEVAITYQLKGPIFYSNFSDNRLEMFLGQVDFMLRTKQAKNLVCIFTDKQVSVCMYFTEIPQNVHITDVLKINDRFAIPSKVHNNEFLTMESIKNRLKNKTDALELTSMLSSFR